MVEGIESFRDKFKDYTDSYTIIGGAACDILMDQVDSEFRATKDIDMILILEGGYQDFLKVLWEYIIEGEYKCGWRNNDEMHFYRFTEPKYGYPIQIELFSRMPDYHLEIPEGIIPIHIDDSTKSLSAILLNEDFYNFMKAGRRVIDGISVLGTEHLIPFKMFAWLDLMDKKNAGEHVNEKDLKKHKYDVFRLLEIAVIDGKIENSGLVRDIIVKFLNEIQSEELPLRQIGVSLSKDAAVEILRDMYL